MTKHTPVPWQPFDTDGKPVNDPSVVSEKHVLATVWINDLSGKQAVANARLMAAAPDMLAALKQVNKLIAEAAMTGFNYADGDWPERLFSSQQDTWNAIRKAEGRP